MNFARFLPWRPLLRAFFPHNFQNQSGNALFLILIAVALFAALSYAVTQSGRGAGSVGREQMELDAAQIIQYAGSIEQSVQRLTLNGTCRPTQLSFENTLVADYANTDDPKGDNSCHIFHADGGGLSVQVPPASAGGPPPNTSTAETTISSAPDGAYMSETWIFFPCTGKSPPTPST